MTISFGVDDDGNVPAPVDTTPIAARPPALTESRSRGMDTSERQDPNCLADAGWGVLFARGIDPDIKTKLGRLLDLRREQVGGPPLYQEFEGNLSYTPGESAQQWLDRVRGVRWATVAPDEGVPYYLLIVASPEDIPFEFQTELDAYFAVGRIWFCQPDGAPELEDFENYAKWVAEYEDPAQPVPTSREIAFFGIRSPDDEATALLMNQLVKPLAHGTELRRPVGHKDNYAVSGFLERTPERSAYKKDLLRILTSGTGNGIPAVLFTATHGRKPAVDNGSFSDLIGGLVCQDWKGPGHPIEEEHFLTANDVKDDANVHGTIHIMYACYGVGCPKESFFQQPGEPALQIAPKSVISRLPQRLLSHPKGGSLAVLGHVDTTYLSTFQTASEKGQDTEMRAIVNQLAAGARIGQAVDQLNLTWLGQRAVYANRSDQWIRAQDARNFTIFGDPAVRLRSEDMPPLAAHASA